MDLKKGLCWILHIFGCNNDDLVEEYSGRMLRCKKCGRVMFVFRK